MSANQMSDSSESGEHGAICPNCERLRAALRRIIDEQPEKPCAYCFDVAAQAKAALANEQTEPCLAKRPVAFRVKDFADGWMLFQDEESAYKASEDTGALMQGLYVRDGT